MNFIRNIIENLKDPKKKSLTLLGIYVIFFVVVFILLNTGRHIESNHEDNYVDKNDEIEEKVNIFSYNYIYRIYDNETMLEINGAYKNGLHNFNYNGLDYSKEYNTVYQNGIESDLDFDVDKYKYDVIELLIENSDSETKYRNSNSIMYSMPIIKYFELLKEESICEELECNDINASITIVKNEYIESVLIDLTNYYKYKYQIEIEYNNINNI